MTDVVIERLRGAIDGYLRQLAQEVPDLSRVGDGRDVLGPVAGRSESEDVEIDLDRYSEDLLQRWLEGAGALKKNHTMDDYRAAVEGLEVAKEDGPDGEPLDWHTLRRTDPDLDELNALAKQLGIRYVIL